MYSGKQDPCWGSRVRTATDERGAVPQGGDDTHNRGSSGVRTQGCEREEARAPQAVLSTSTAPQPEAQWSPPARCGVAAAAPLSPGALPAASLGNDCGTRNRELELPHKSGACSRLSAPEGTRA